MHPFFVNFVNKIITNRGLELQQFSFNEADDSVKQCTTSPQMYRGYKRMMEIRATNYCHFVKLKSN